MVSKPLSVSKMQEEKEIEKIHLINALNPWYTGLVAGRPPYLPLLLLDTPKVGSRELQAPPWYDEKRVSPL